MRSRMIVSSIVIFLYFSTEKVELRDSDPAQSSGGSSEDIVERLTIDKAPRDYHLYQGLKLKNDLQVLLISDPDTEESAASMAVGVGTLYENGEEEEGLANLTAQVLLMGSKKYKKHYAFGQMLEKNGGDVRGPTVTEETTALTFWVNSNVFMDALEKFAQMFLNPLLVSESKLSLLDPSTWIEAQYGLYKKKDANRIQRVERTVWAEPGHPINHVLTGQFKRDTYKLLLKAASKWEYYFDEEAAVRRKAKDFFSTYYSSNIMRLVVVGKESLNKLEKRVVALFKNLENKNVERRTYPYSEHPFSQPGKPKYKIYVVPRKENKPSSLRLSFPLPDFRDSYEAAFDIYVDYILVHEGPGSLASFLQSKGWYTSIKFDYVAPAGIGIATIVFELTDIAIGRIDYIINLTFKYIQMMRDDGIHEWLFDELTISNKRAFEYHAPDDEPLSLAEGLALRLMNGRRLEKVLSGEFCRGKWNESVIRRFVSYLRPDNVNVTITSNVFRKFAQDVEGYCGTKHRAVPINAKMIEAWLRPEDAHSELRLPTPNKFIPANFDVFDLGENEPKYPRIIHQSRISEIWFKQDDEFRVPELQIRLVLFSSQTRLGPLQQNSWNLFHALLKPILEECLYSAEISEVKWVDWSLELDENDDGLEIKVLGLSEKLPTLLEVMLLKITNLGNYLEENSFKRAREKLEKRKQSDFGQHHRTQTLSYTKNLTQNAWNNTEMVQDAIRMLKMSDMRKFLSKVFRRIFIRGFIHGNCTKNKALEIVSNIEKYFPRSDGLLLYETFGPRYIEFENRSRFIYRTVNRERNVYGYSSFFQLQTEPSSAVNDVCGLVLQSVIDKRCVDHFPKLSKEEAAECVYASDMYGVRGFYILTVSQEIPRALDKMTETFLLTVPELIEGMPDDRFDSFKEQTEPFMKAGTLHELSDLYWAEICNRFYEFDRMEHQLRLLRSLKRQHLLAFIQKMFAAKSERRRKLSIWVLPEDKRAALKPVKAQYTAIIKNILDFRNSSILLAYNARVTPEKFFDV